MNDELPHDRLTPKWLRDVVRLLPIRSQFICSGNMDDLFLFPNGKSHELMPAHSCLWGALAPLGFEFLVRYNPVDGISLYPRTDNSIKKAHDLGITLTGEKMPAASLESFSDILRKIVTHRSYRIAVVLDNASRIPKSPKSLSPDEHRFFAACDKLAQEAKAVYYEEKNQSFFNPVIWMVRRLEDLPPWFGPSNSRIHTQEINKPDHDQRLNAAKLLLPQFGGYDNTTEQARVGYAKIFADMTDALALQDMQDVAQLGGAQRLGLEDIDDAVRSYKTGDQTLDNPWRSTNLKDRIDLAQRKINDRVRGQSAAIELSLDILKRSVMGLTGAHTSSSHGRPRGVLFLAGPTGVGKTELAKALTESLFGNEQAYIRFDMSEFSAEHADARLLGAPPGYVGYEGGGELTGAVRAKPFSLILFDEIEKAHPRILDKFLQILEDGRLTDGRGETVYFSESIIVFTSNLGIVGENKEGKAVFLVKPGETYEAVREKVLEGIRNHFTLRMGRPEILNRLGDNIVVFNFIEPEIAREIFDLMMGNIQRRVLEEHSAELVFSDVAQRQLLEWSTADLSNGGRGIGSCLETMLVNPLARALFSEGSLRGKTITVSSMENKGCNYSANLSVS